jgi:hypothetical protein
MTLPARPAPSRPLIVLLISSHLQTLTVTTVFLNDKNSIGAGAISVTIDKTKSNSLLEFGTLDAVTEKLKASFKKGDSIEIVRSVSRFLLVASLVLSLTIGDVRVE